MLMLAIHRFTDENKRMATPEAPRVLFATGITGSGKSTLVGKLITESGFCMLGADTTRDPRESDLPGEFNCRTDDEFDRIDPADMLYLAQHGSATSSSVRPPSRYTLLRSAVEKAIGDEGHYYTRPLAPISAGILLREYGHDIVRVIYLPDPSREEAERRIIQRGDDPSILASRMNDETTWYKIAEQTPGIHIARNTTIEGLHQEALDVMGIR